MTNDFLNEILAIKIIPSYLFVQKAVSSYTINLYYDDGVYQLNNYYIYDVKIKLIFTPQIIIYMILLINIRDD